MSSADRIVQRGTLYHAIGDDTRNRDTRLTRPDCLKATQRRDLFRHRTLEAEPFEAPTERLERGYRSGQSSPTRLLA
jgi:hypothetical protein